LLSVLPVGDRGVRSLVVGLDGVGDLGGRLGSVGLVRSVGGLGVGGAIGGLGVGDLVIVLRPVGRLVRGLAGVSRGRFVVRGVRTSGLGQQRAEAFGRVLVVTAGERRGRGQDGSGSSDRGHASIRSTEDGGPKRTRLDPDFPEQPPGQLENSG
jgi:hypothetical protein